VNVEGGAGVGAPRKLLRMEGTRSDLDLDLLCGYLPLLDTDVHEWPWTYKYTLVYRFM